MKPEEPSLPPLLQLGLEAYNRQDFFEAHEIWERAWREDLGGMKTFYQGLLQCAVVNYHLCRGNWKGAQSLHPRSMALLAPWAGNHRGLNVTGLMEDQKKLMALVENQFIGTPGSVPIDCFKPIGRIQI